jgi:hypothetical protein
MTIRYVSLSLLKKLHGTFLTVYREHGCPRSHRARSTADVRKQTHSAGLGGKTALYIYSCLRIFFASNVFSLGISGDPLEA